MKNIVPTFLVLIVFLLTGCQKDDLVIAEGEYTLEEGFTMTFNDDGDFKIHFDEVRFDARPFNSEEDQDLALFGFTLITSKGDIDQAPHILPTWSSRTLFYTPVGIYSFKLLGVTPSRQELTLGTTDLYKIRFSLTEE